MNSSAWLIFGAIIFAPIFIAVFSIVFIFRRNRRGKRTPLTGNLLRSPGETLRKEIERISEKMDDAFLTLFATCVPPIIFILLLAVLQGDQIPILQLILIYIFFLMLVAWASRRLYLLLKQRAKLYLGLDAELAVGQELNQLMLHGCRIYHDFPAEEFNIDHVVVGPGGVFAVETKGRAKPDQGRGNIDAKVFYDGEALKFPDWHEKKPLDQALRQAVWLSKWLSSAVGEPVKALPVLALPGWFVERTRAGEVFVINGKSPFMLAKPQGRAPLSETLIQQISHQLEQRCRDVEPVAYRRVKKK